jgi:hypothetical protein
MKPPQIIPRQKRQRIPRNPERGHLRLTLPEGGVVWIGEAEIRIRVARRGQVRFEVNAPRSVVVKRENAPTLEKPTSSVGEHLGTDQSQAVPGSNPGSASVRPDKGGGSQG